MYSVNNANNITGVGQQTSLYTRDLHLPHIKFKKRPNISVIQRFVPNFYFISG